ncbi:MAG: hypothetical protein GY910_23970 [bacterium]|nr:hypothetical protein [Deltaproteobacteria bacterium]MCP4908040.1 hypothetical protein [bacterium]
MSESLNDVAFDLEDTPLDADESSPLNDLYEWPLPSSPLSAPLLPSSPSPPSSPSSPSVRSITNSPGCTPSLSSSSPSHTSQPPHGETGLRPVRRARTIRTDAWSVPASANWTRTRNPIRKVSRVSRSTDWALPF